MIAMQIKQALSLPDQEIGTSGDIPQSIAHENDTGLETPSPFMRSSTRKSGGQIPDQQYGPWTAIAKAIDSLFKLAAAVRDGDKSGGDEEVPGHYSRPDDSYFEELAKLLVRRWFPHARRDLSDQLGRSIHLRWRRILYRRRHEEKLQFQQSAALTDQVGAETTALPGYMSTLLRESNDRKEDHLPVSGLKNYIVAPSLTQFSQFHTQSTIMRRAGSATVVTGRTKGSLVPESEELEYPQPPADFDQNGLVFCPYCCQQLNHSQLNNWSRHVDKDLKPFICLFETCQHPLQFFALQSEWLQHMHSNHGYNWPQTVHMMTWFCDIDHEHQLEFANVDDFREHLVTHELSAPKQDVLIRHNQGIGNRLPGICPLCEDAPDQNINVKPHRLFDHIAHHLKRIALVALPSADAESDPDNAGSGFQSDLAWISNSSNNTVGLLSRSDFVNEDTNDKIADDAIENTAENQHPKQDEFAELYGGSKRVTSKEEIAKQFRSYQKISRLAKTTTEAKYKCTLGCAWSHKMRSNWRRHERAHYPPEIWVCLDEDCRDRSVSKRVSYRKDLAQRHYKDYHLWSKIETFSEHEATKRIGKAPLSEAQLEDLRVDVPDSMFPKQCVFGGCLERFESWDNRCTHIEAHLAKGDALDRRAIKNYHSFETDIHAKIDFDDESKHGSYAFNDLDDDNYDKNKKNDTYDKHDDRDNDGDPGSFNTLDPNIYRLNDNIGGVSNMFAFYEQLAPSYTDHADEPDLFRTLSEEQSVPPEEDMKPEDPDMKPEEQEVRFEGDLYTPRFVRGHGNKREGYCGFCKPGSWLVLKNSAFWYDKSFMHGISAATGQPFDAPKETRRMSGNPDVWEGLCGTCDEWVALKFHKKKGITWFRHAYKCHNHQKSKEAPKKRRDTIPSRAPSRIRPIKKEMHVSSAAIKSEYLRYPQIENGDQAPGWYNSSL